MSRTMRTVTGRARASGVTLIELMIGMTIGLLVVGFAFALFMNTNASNRSATQVADLLDMSRVALDEIANDVRQAGYWGLVPNLDLVDGRKGSANPIAAAKLPADDCDVTEWTSDLQRYLVLQDGSTTFDCIDDRGYIGDTDVLVVKRVSSNPLALNAPLTLAGIVPSRLHIVSDRKRGVLFLGTDRDTYDDGFAVADSEVRALLTNFYYVSETTAVPRGRSSLRRLSLEAGVGRPIYKDVELVPGVEDLQILCGIDTNADGSVDAYVPPSTVGSEPVIALRISLLMHAATLDLNYQDTGDYLSLGNAEVRFDDLDRRRMQFSKTIMLRNQVVSP